MIFKRIYIEITNKCNLSCSFCSPMNRKQNSMGVWEFEDVILQIKSFTKYVYLHVKGEPLMHPMLGKILAICEKYDIKVNITTNGTLLKEKGSLILASPALRQVNISLHSFLDSEENEQYLQNALAFCRRANYNDVYSVLRLWNYDNNLINDSNKSTIEFIEKAFNKEINSKIIQSNSTQLAKNIFMSWEKQFVWPNLDNPYVSNTGSCHGMKDLIAILVDGTVVPCCLDGDGIIQLGNVLYQDFKDILETDRAKSMIKGFNTRVITESLCKHCSYRTRFDKKESTHDNSK